MQINIRKLLVRTGMATAIVGAGLICFQAFTKLAEMYPWVGRVLFVTALIAVVTSVLIAVLDA